MKPVEDYIRELHAIRSTGAGVKETSYYGALANLLNEVGKTLKPKVQCVLTLRNTGAGLPDGGLFLPNQLQRAGDDPLSGQTPARGVIEVKGTGDDIDSIAKSEQVARYLDRYGQVLITNYRDFLFVTRASDGSPARGESYRLAKSEPDFWAHAAHPRTMAEAHGLRLEEYLRRVMLNKAMLSEPKDVAWFLASYAREARARVEAAQELPGLEAVRTALEEALGLKFEGEKGSHFFNSTLVQTLFYGIFSAWVLWDKKTPRTDRSVHFDWKVAAWYLHVPMISALFAQVSTPDRLGRYGLEEVLNWAGDVLNRVDRTSFFDHFQESHAVQYFYEPFLEAFDPELRKQLGVWYTPPEIVEYMVARVDTALKDELGIEDGLADPRVYVLDPCCGTGAYLVEVLRHIETTLKKKGVGALLGEDVKKAATERVFGFEILPAPFVVAHLQLGLMLQSLGAPLSDDSGERAGVFLTNALTGWEPPTEEAKRQLKQLSISYPELKHERDLADQIKTERPILVVLGNPPYNAFAGVSPKEEQGLVEPYKEGLISEWGIKKFNLDDLYVRFFRLAERRIAEMSGMGVVCYISNFSYLSDPSFVVMRKRFLSQFDSLWFDCLNGDSRETGKLTPEGMPDPSVFSTQYNREGIRVGTAIGLMVRKQQRSETPIVRFRQYWGTTKRADLVDSLNDTGVADYVSSAPAQLNRYSFRPQNVSTDYASWPQLPDLSSIPPLVGMEECRGGALIDIDRTRLADRLRGYLDPSVDLLPTQMAGLAERKSDFDPKTFRDNVVAKEKFDDTRVLPYAVRPFDTRWCYHTLTPGLWNRPRPALSRHVGKGNVFVLSRMNVAVHPEGSPIFLTRHLFDKQTTNRNPAGFPLMTQGHKPHRSPAVSKTGSLFGDEDVPIQSTEATANLSVSSRKYLSHLNTADTDCSFACASLIWMHVLAIGYSPKYLAENADGLRQDWPRIPLPDTRGALETSAELGKQVAALLDTETPVTGVTSGQIREELRQIGVVSVENSESLDLTVTAGWGHAGQGGVTMPARGKYTRRPYTPAELQAFIRIPEAAKCLGDTTFDVYLNNGTYWKNIPERVWNYTIGGYQVIKKWLSYREHELLGRPLTIEEAHYVEEMTRRIAAIVLLEPELDTNYNRVKSSTYPWPQNK